MYDAEGERVMKGHERMYGFTPTAEVLLGPGAEPVSVLDGGGNWLRTNLYAAGKLLATYDSLGVHYALTDWLGTKRMQVSSTGTVEESCVSLPFGDSLNCFGTDANTQHFTDKERDAESGNDYFGARYYGSNVAGRFMTPDPSGLYFANPNYPQSLNLYAYVQNNPLMFTDPTGMDCIYSSGGFQPGHCTSDPNNGVDVPGTINTSSFDPTTGIFNYTYTPYDTSVGLGAGVIVFPTTNPTLSPYTTFSPIPLFQQQGPQQGAGTPNNGPTVSHCLGVAGQKNGTALGLDAAGVGAGFLPGGDLVVAGAQGTISAASGINSALKGDAFGTASCLVPVFDGLG